MPLVLASSDGTANQAATRTEAARASHWHGQNRSRAARKPCSPKTDSSAGHSSRRADGRAGSKHDSAEVARDQDADLRQNSPNRMRSVSTAADNKNGNDRAQTKPNQTHLVLKLVVHTMLRNRSSTQPSKAVNHHAQDTGMSGVVLDIVAMRAVLHIILEVHPPLVAFVSMAAGEAAPASAPPRGPPRGHSGARPGMDATGEYGSQGCTLRTQRSQTHREADTIEGSHRRESKSQRHHCR